jgi:hypothetical protein
MKKLVISLLLLSVVYPFFAQDNRADVLQGLEKNQNQKQIPTQEVKRTATLKSATRLFATKEDVSSVIMVSPSGEVVDVVDSDSTFLHVNYQNNEGYILSKHATINETPAAAVPTITAVPAANAAPASQQPENYQEQDTTQQEQVNRFTYLENKYGTDMANRLYAGKIWKGMNGDMVRDSWGNPFKINRVFRGNVITEEWIYRSTWLFFSDDKLTQWGPTKR